MAVAVRRAEPADAAILTRVAHAAKRHWRYPEELILLWKGALSVSEDYVEANPVFCAVQGAEIVGFYSLVGDGDTRELDHFWVVPQHIGTGVGTRLFDHVLLTVRESGGRSLHIAADPHAEGFYVKMGARRVGDCPSIPEGRRLPLLQYDL